LDVVFPWLYNLTKITHNNIYHLEGSVFNHTMLALKLAKDDLNAAWCVLFHDVGKYSSYVENGNFHKHYSEDIVNENFKEIEKTLSLSKEELEISRFFALYHHRFHNVFENSIKPSKIANILFKVKSKKKLNSLLIASLADMKGREGEKHKLLFSHEDILNIYEQLKKADYEVDHKSMGKEQIVSKISHKQSHIIREYLNSITHLRN
ncbi:MAG: HD domain-containing protein, partial [Campylobacteraceae bacterium]|nr:HD domain-containing protein [Campylobacteraceae bacterium]